MVTNRKSFEKGLSGPSPVLFDTLVFSKGRACGKANDHNFIVLVIQIYIFIPRDNAAVHLLT
jgi:hypothetical protein